MEKERASRRFTREELDGLSGEVLPERAAMSVIANLARVDPGLSVDVLSDDPGPEDADDTTGDGS